MGKSGIHIEVPKFELDKLNRDLKRYSEHKRSQISLEIEGALVQTLADAKSSLNSQSPGRGGAGLAGSGYVKYFKDKLSGMVWFNRFYAAYLEFGTGKNVFKGSSFKFTTGMKQYASQFKKGGKRNPNLKARPYLFPAFVENTKNLVSNIKKLLEKK